MAILPGLSAVVLIFFLETFESLVKNEKMKHGPAKSTRVRNNYETAEFSMIFLILLREKMYLNTLNPKKLVSIGLYYLVFEIMRYL